MRHTVVTRPPCRSWRMAFLAVVLLTSLAATAATAPGMPREGTPIQMITLENPPLAFTAPSGEITGILVDRIREAVRRTGHEVEFRIEPWKRVLQEVADGNADAAFNAGKTEEREQWGRYSSSVLFEETYVFFAREPMELSQTLDEAASLRVGTQLGYYYGERFDHLLQDPPFRSLQVSHTIERNLRLLQADRTNVFIGDLLPTLYYIEQMGLEGQIHIVREKGTDFPLVVSTSPTYVAFSRETIAQAYVDEFNQALESMKYDSTFEGIRENYRLGAPELP